MRLLKQDAPFICDESSQQYFEALKRAFLSAPLLGPLDYTKNFLYCIWLNHTLWLGQCQFRRMISSKCTSFIISVGLWMDLKLGIRTLTSWPWQQYMSFRGCVTIYYSRQLLQLQRCKSISICSIPGNCWRKV